MSVRGKRLWAHRLDFSTAFDEAEAFLRRTKEHNLLRPSPATLYHAYLLEGSWPTDGLDELSTYLRFGPKDSPQIDRGRVALARLLAVALKAHFFLAEEAIVLNEPYVFIQPDLALMGQMRYGLIYPIEMDNRIQCIAVADWDLSMSGSKRLKLPNARRFPTVLPEQDYQWLNLDQWKRLAHQAKTTLGSTKAFARPNFYNQARNHTDVATFNYGTTFDYPREMNADVIAVGGMWAKGIRKWFLPLGFDIEAAREYLDLQLGRSVQERHDLRWWDLAPIPPRE